MKDKQPTIRYGTRLVLLHREEEGEMNVVVIATGVMLFREILGEVLYNH